MGLNVTIFRRASRELFWGAVFQSVGTENLGSKVGVGGTGYLLSLGYEHTHSDRFSISGGIIHLSTHLTRDLDAKLEEERSRGAPIPIVDDPSEYNVLFVRAHVKWPAYAFMPELEAAVHPINFQFTGSAAADVRPIYLASRWTLWQRSRQSIVAGTQHEIGSNPFNVFSLFYGLETAGQRARRFEIFVSAAPGKTLHVSPNVGGIRDGLAFGIRMKFRA